MILCNCALCSGLTPSRDWGSYEGVIYWDNNATTPLAPEVYEAMEPFLKERFFNPSAGYGCARHVREAVEEARAAVAALLGAFPSEIVFTSGGTEASNMAFRQMAGGQEGGIGVLSTDHDASLKTALALGCGCVCPVDREGRAIPEKWESMCAGGVSGVSFAWANNETGALQDAPVLCSSARKHGVPVHLDIVQCAGKIPVDLHGMEVDYASVSSHKFHGPKGIGCLYRRAGAPFSPLLFGGGQEYGLRSGTENVPGIAGISLAARTIYQDLDVKVAKMRNLKKHFIEGVSRIEDTTVHGLYDETSAPHIISVGFAGIRSEVLLHALEEKGIYVSSGSACSSNHPQVSGVLKGIGARQEFLDATLRFSMSEFTTPQEIDYTLDTLYNIVPNLRKYTRR